MVQKWKNPVAQSTDEVARYQAKLGNEAEKQGNHKEAAKWRAQSTDNWRLAKAYEKMD